MSVRDSLKDWPANFSIRIAEHAFGKGIVLKGHARVGRMDHFVEFVLDDDEKIGLAIRKAIGLVNAMIAKGLAEC